MSDLISKISDFFGSQGGQGLGKALQAGFTGAGTVGNVLDMIQRGQQYSKLKQWESLSPAQLAAKVNAATQPLSTGLTQSVENQVQGGLAERGLATSPAIAAATYGQALAPYQLANQNQALNLLLTQMGLPAQGASMAVPPANLSNAWAQLFNRNNQSTTPSDYKGFTDLIWGNPSPQPQTEGPSNFGTVQWDPSAYGLTPETA